MQTHGKAWNERTACVMSKIVKSGTTPNKGNYKPTLNNAFTDGDDRSIN